MSDLFYTAKTNMLLTSSSAPIPTSWLPNSSSPQPQLTCNLPTTLAIINPSKTEKKKNCVIPRSTSNVIVEKQFSTCGLDKQVVDHEEEGKKVGKLQTLVMGDGMGSDNGGRICGGNYGSGWESNHETDAYYHNMIQANPNNALLLSNYAKFLKEVCGNYAKAEEYVERAILANPGDAEALSLYADLIWQTEKNADRAEDYFDQAVKSDPDDCYVLASYAKFLWDVDEAEDKTDESHTTYPPDLCQGTNNGRSPSCYSTLSN